MVFNLDFKEFKFSHKIDEHPDMNPGFAYHAHTLYEVLLFIEGDVEYVIENRKYILKPYDLLFIKPGEHHYLKLLSKKRYDRMVFRFPDYFIPKIIETSLMSKPTLVNVESTEILTIFDRFDHHQEKFSGEKLHALFRTTLSELLIYLNEIGVTDSVPEYVDETVEDILYYINDHLDSQISVNDICQTYYISKTKLYRMFFDAMQIPIAQYIRNKKVMMAYALIKNGQKPTQVFEDLGFKDYSTFYRTYLKVVGSPPSMKD